MQWCYLLGSSKPVTKFVNRLWIRFWQNLHTVVPMPHIQHFNLVILLQYFNGLSQTYRFGILRISVFGKFDLGHVCVISDQISNESTIWRPENIISRRNHFLWKKKVRAYFCKSVFNRSVVEWIKRVLLKRKTRVWFPVGSNQTSYEEAISIAKNGILIIIKRKLKNSW